MESLKLGQRTLIAMTCWRCGAFMPGGSFGRHARKLTDSRTYIDRRCTRCKWGDKAK